jgi:etoposide-induced 2.4 mRNA
VVEVFVTNEVVEVFVTNKVVLKKINKMNDIISEVFSHTTRGFRDALHFRSMARYFAKSKQLQGLFAKTVLLNGAIFLGSIVVLDYIIAPTFMGNFFWQTSDIEQNRLISVLFSILKNILWVVPLYILSFLFNAIWYSDIAKLTYTMQEKRRAKLKQLQEQSGIQQPIPVQQGSGLTFRRDLVDKITDLIYLNILLLFYSLIQAASRYIPIIGGLIDFLTFTWYSAFYSFQYLWAHKNMSLQKQIDYFERHWAYMLGFGAPAALASYFFPFFINAGVYAMLFPIFIVLAILASPPPVRTDMHPVPVFYAAKGLLGLLCLIIGKCSKTGKKKISFRENSHNNKQNIDSVEINKQTVKFSLPQQN